MTVAPFAGFRFYALLAVSILSFSLLVSAALSFRLLTFAGFGFFVVFIFCCVHRLDSHILTDFDFKNLIRNISSLNVAFAGDIPHRKFLSVRSIICNNCDHITLLNCNRYGTVFIFNCIVTLDRSILSSEHLCLYYFLFCLGCICLFLLLRILLLCLRRNFSRSLCRNYFLDFFRSLCRLFSRRFRLHPVLSGKCHRIGRHSDRNVRGTELIVIQFETVSSPACKYQPALLRSRNINLCSFLNLGKVNIRLSTAVDECKFIYRLLCLRFSINSSNVDYFILRRNGRRIKLQNCLCTVLALDDHFIRISGPFGENKPFRIGLRSADLFAEFSARICIVSGRFAVPFRIDIVYKYFVCICWLFLICNDPGISIKFCVKTVCSITADLYHIRTACICCQFIYQSRVCCRISHIRDCSVRVCCIGVCSRINCVRCFLRLRSCRAEYRHKYQVVIHSVNSYIQSAARRVHRICAKLAGTCKFRDPKLTDLVIGDLRHGSVRLYSVYRPSCEYTGRVCRSVICQVDGSSVRISSGINIRCVDRLRHSCLICIEICLVSSQRVCCVFE